MITGTEIYWITRMDNIRVAIGVFLTIWAFVTLGVSIGCFICSIWPDNEKEKHMAELLRRFIIIPTWALLCCLISAIVLIPTTKEVCAIKAIPIIVNNEQVQELPNKVVELANEWIDELKPSKESE